MDSVVFSQIISLVAMLIPNIYTLIVECAWFGTAVRSCSFVTWTCWNTIFMLILFSGRSLKFWKRKGMARKSITA